MSITRIRHDLRDLRQSLRAAGWSCTAVNHGRANRRRVHQGESTKDARGGYISTIIEYPSFLATREGVTVRVEPCRLVGEVAIAFDLHRCELVRGHIAALHYQLEEIFQAREAACLTQQGDLFSGVVDG